MQLDPKIPPRRFFVGQSSVAAWLSDCGSISLDANEQVTFVTLQGREYDVCRKSWGYYATPSTNGRLKGFGWRTALVCNARGLLYVMLVEPEAMTEFEMYCVADDQRVLFWLDDETDVAKLLAVAQ